MIEVDTVKGFRDYLPEDAIKREKIKKIAETIFKSYGFKPLETPIVEYDELMRPDTLPSEGEDEAIADRFKLQDRGGRNLGLRYEFTFQLARILKLNPNLKMPFKRFQIGPIFRDEPIRAGRTRQFTQCDIDILGDETINSDSECISAMNTVFNEIGIKNFEIQINNRKLLDAIIESVEIREKRQVMRELDKISKLGEDEVKANLKKYTSSNQIVTLFKLMEKPIDFFLENAFDGAQELSDLINKLKLYGVKTKFNPFMIRGFAYYTGNIFEFTIPNKSSIAGGGRYDKTVGKYVNRDIPAVGISFSLESLFGLCEEEIEKIKIESIPIVTIISLNEDKTSIKLAIKLRKEGLSVNLAYGQVGKQLEYANSQSIPYVIFIGQEEIKKKKFKIKNMISGDEKFLTETQIIKLLKK